MFSLVLSVASVILSLYIPVLAGRAIDGIKLSGDVDFEVIKKCLFGILICAAVGGVLQWVMNIINNRIAYNTVRDIRSKAFAHMQTLPVAFADSHPYGDIVSRITADIVELNAALGVFKSRTVLVRFLGLFVYKLKNSCRAGERILKLGNNAGNFVERLGILV